MGTEGWDVSGGRAGAQAGHETEEAARGGLSGSYGVVGGQLLESWLKPGDKRSQVWSNDTDI